MYDIDMNKDRPTAFSGQSGRQDSPMEKFIGKLRPQIFLSIILLGVVAFIGMFKGMTEVTVGCVAGIIALAKDVLQSDS
tara:strand:- start:818 stop:1054 length:237 start_codon:yes stop_codon:yes gene_type:complete